MKLDKIKFTESQLIRIYEFLSNLEKCNQDIMSNCTISGIDMKVSVKNNFVCSYYISYFGDSDGIQGEIKYLMIDKEGDKEDLMDVYRSEDEIVHIMNKMENIEV